jgi:rod shape-determining protein MreC
MFTQPRRRLRFRWLFLGAVLVVAVVLLLNSSAENPARGAASRLTLPVQTALSRLGDGIRNIFDSVGDLATLRDRNAELEQALASLTIENLRLHEVEAENGRLRELLNFAETRSSYDYRGGQVVGRVVSNEPGNLVQSILINLGSGDGIAPGMPVVTELGLVGRITDVFPTSARVLLITDSDSSVNALLQNTRMRGLLHGRATPSEPTVLDFLPPDQPIPVGDIVVTSGEGGRFPAGIPIGQVVEVEQNDVEMFQRAIVRTTVDFNRLETVLVVTDFIPAVEPTQPTETP